MVRPYGHRTSSPPSRRLLARRPLDLGLGLRVQTLAADHRDTNSTATVPSSLYCCHRIGVVSYDFSDNTHTQVCSAGILNFRHPSVEKIPPWAAPTPVSSHSSQSHSAPPYLTPPHLTPCHCTALLVSTPSRIVDRTLTLDGWRALLLVLTSGTELSGDFCATMLISRVVGAYYHCAYRLYRFSPVFLRHHSHVLLLKHVRIR